MMTLWAWSAFTETLIKLTVAFVLGGLVGLERQYRQRTAGLRTNVLVAVGAAFFVDMAGRIFAVQSGSHGMVHVVAYIVSGIGFLGAGVIMRESGNIRGINTAATLWAVAAVGAATGAGLLAEATAATLFIIAANTLLRPVVNRMNRQPVDVAETEATYQLTILTPRANQKQALAWLEQNLERTNLPMRELNVEPFDEKTVEVTVTLLATSLDGDELDDLVHTINQAKLVSQAYWSLSTSL